jgi:pimeloyl-ACP methyl ester carboxylesterase
MPEISVRGRGMAFEAKPAVFDASSLAVLFIHGTGGDLNDWRFQLESLSDRFTVISVSLPGHGDSEETGDSTVAAFSERVSAFIETLGLRKVVVVGCSLGSAIALWLSLSQKPWLAGIGLVGSGSRLRVHPALLEGVLQDKDRALGMLVDFALGQNPEATLRSLVLQKFLANPAQTIHDDLAACNEFDVMDRLGHVSVRTVIIVGEEDRLTPVKYSRFLHEGIPGSTMTVIPRAGHLVMVERPVEFDAALAEFLSSLASSCCRGERDVPVT